MGEYKTPPGYRWIVIKLVVFLCFLLYVVTVINKPSVTKEENPLTTVNKKALWTTETIHEYYADTTNYFNLYAGLSSIIYQSEGRGDVNSIEDYVEVFNSLVADEYLLMLGDTINGKLSMELVRLVQDSTALCLIDHLCDGTQLAQLTPSPFFYGTYPQLLFIDSVLVQPYEKWQKLQQGYAVDDPDILIEIDDKIVAEMKLR